VRDRPSEAFDVGIFANAAYTGHLKGLCGRTVLVTHGIVPDEAPAEGFDRVVFTSEEVRDHWGGGEVIRQPLDIGFWRPDPMRGHFLTRFANRSGLDMAPEVAERLGMKFQHARHLKPPAARQAIWQSACVLASGRCAVEAMACGVPLVVADERHYQGPLLDPDAVGSMLRNYSGRGGVVPTTENLAAAVQAAIERGSLRAHVEKHHGAAQVVDQLLGVV
jgi:hypothetical protein